MSESVEVQIAVLAGKMEANHAETRARLESLELRVLEKVTDLERDVSHNRANADQKFAATDRRFEKLEDRVSLMERLREKATGWIAGAIAVAGAIGGAIAFAADKLIR